MLYNKAINVWFLGKTLEVSDVLDDGGGGDNDDGGDDDDSGGGDDGCGGDDDDDGGDDDDDDDDDGDDGDSDDKRYYNFVFFLHSYATSRPMPPGTFRSHCRQSTLTSEHVGTFDGARS